MVNGLRKQIDIMQRALDDLEEAVVALEATLEEKNDDLRESDKKIAALEEALDDLKSENRELRTEISE